MREYNDLVKLAERAALRAAEFVRSAARPTVHNWMEKSQHDFVTEVDRAAEGMIVEILTREEPESVIIGEELSPQRRPSGKLVWIVDPLDGTTNFLHGYPQYAVSIACLADGKLVAGVIHDVCRQRTFKATRGGGAYEEDTRLSVSAVTEPRYALIGTGFPFRTLNLLPAFLAQFAAVIGASSGVRRAGSAALDLADVAAGRLDGFWEQHLASWDIAAGVLLIREAGGVVTRLDGTSDVLGADADGSIVAGNASVHKWLIELVRRS
ncbi:MAG TPA: inositol monophosphatase family protein [Gemmatimonadales bacterium]|nr:inositol monophosphatase family protein [Gemmatimonadales bacterium]